MCVMSAQFPLNIWEPPDYARSALNAFRILGNSNMFAARPQQPKKVPRDPNDKWYAGCILHTSLLWMRR